MRPIDLNGFDTIRLSINIFKRPTWLDDEMGRVLEAFINPTSEASKIAARDKVVELRGRK